MCTCLYTYLCTTECIQDESRNLEWGGRSLPCFDQFLEIVSYTDPSEFLMTAVIGI